MLLAAGSVIALDPRYQKRIAVEKIEDAKAPLALTDNVMLTVGARHIAQHIRFGAHPMQIDREWVFGRRIALQDETDRTVQPDRRLRGRNRPLAAERDRQHGAGKQHKAAGRNQNQGIFGQSRNPGQQLFDRTGRRRTARFRGA